MTYFYDNQALNPLNANLNLILLLIAFNSFYIKINFIFKYLLKINEILKLIIPLQF